MSFGFSIGDIVLLSQLTFKLYTSVTSGRKAASRDLKELEDVLFSLKCSLDHLGEVAKDISARAKNEQSGSNFKENLDRMIAACGSTLQELDTVTKAYREVGIDSEVQLLDEKVTVKKRTFEDVKAGIKVNWKKVRWDQEKQSLQQYRDKIKAHCDAVNLILTSTIWANTTQNEANSKINHEKTHSLLEGVLKNSQTEVSFQKMITEIHATLTTTGKQAQIPAPGVFPPYTSIQSSQNDIDIHPQSKRQLQTFAYSANMSFTLPYRTVPKHLPSTTIALNNQRRAFAAKEYKAFKARYPDRFPITKPGFLTTSTPTLPQLRLSIPHLFQPLLIGKLEVQQRSREINRWVECFWFLVHENQADKDRSEEFVQLLVALNEGLEKSERKMKQLFYEISALSGMQRALDWLQSVSKSVRLMKEIEEFEDIREDLEDEG